MRQFLAGSSWRHGSEFGNIWNWQNHGSVRSGHFELHGLAPDIEVPVFFLDSRRKLGATVSVSGKSVAGGPVTVRLEPCGSAAMRLVDPRGQPVAGRVPPWLIRMVITPGSLFQRSSGKIGRALG